MRRLPIALAVLAGIFAAPAAASAAECTLAFTPSTAYVGTTDILASGTGWEPNDTIFVDIPSDPGWESEAMWSADENGNLHFTGVDAVKPLLGTRTWTAQGYACRATADLTVLALPGVPATDAIASQEAPSPPIGGLAVMLVAFGLSSIAFRRRHRPLGK